MLSESLAHLSHACCLEPVVCPPRIVVAPPDIALLSTNAVVLLEFDTKPALNTINILFEILYFNQRVV